MSCDFDYPGENLALKFWTNLDTFQPKSIGISFKKQPVSSMMFVLGQSFMPKQVFTFNSSFNKTPIDFFGFSTDRIFSIVLEFEVKKNPRKLYTESFNVTLPVVKQTEVHFKPPGTTYPDAVTRCICTQAFKMTGENSASEIQRCIILEEFKLMSIVDRYKIYGYIDMLKLFLDIENSFELDLVKKFSLNNSELHKLGVINFKINVSLII